jgi:small-conductance mechanosensitive channel
MSAPAWTAEVLAAVGVATTLALLRHLLARRFRALAARTANPWDDHVADLLVRTHPGLFVLVGAWVGTTLAAPEGELARWVGRGLTVAVLLQVGRWASGAIEVLAARRRARAVEEGQAGDATAWTVLSFCARLGVWAVLALVALDNVGVDVTALVAGLGIGGLAIGLAVQNVLGDLLASLAIVLDRPFAIGDFLVVGDEMGTVEHVGLKTTRIRALSGEQIVVSNADLLASRIRNFKLLTERRVVVQFGVLYETSPEQLAAIPDLVRALVGELPGTRFERAHFCRLGESSLDFEVVYHLLDPDYTRHMDVQQALLLGLFRSFGERGIGFAYPTRTLWVHDARAEAAALPVEEAARAGA